jgi:hypothetical protein
MGFMGSRPRIQVVGLNHKTYSRGSVEAVSADSADAPKVTANYFKERWDLFGMWITRPGKLPHNYGKIHHF